MAGTLSVRVHYPAQGGRVVLRTEMGWQTDVEAAAVHDGGNVHEFRVTTDRPWFYFKPCHVGPGGFRWSVGSNYLAVTGAPEGRSVYPFFYGELRGDITPAFDFYSHLTGTTHRVRVYQPPGYSENHLKRYPTLYMQDGHNLFFPEEAAFGVEWRVDETMQLLDSMNVIDKVLVVAVYPRDRMHEYTRPGYEDYGRFVVEELKREVDKGFRTLGGPENTAVMGSSLGGVVSLYLAWQYPHVFGNAACLSSTFTYRDDLMQRIASEPKRDVRLYLDSGWPGDNYEVTRSMRDLLLRRGFRHGHDLTYYAFPEALHSETYWATRSHIPFQFFFDKRPSPGVPA